jgi:hypothetical protein
MMQPNRNYRTSDPERLDLPEIARVFVNTAVACEFLHYQANTETPLLQYCNKAVSFLVPGLDPLETAQGSDPAPAIKTLPRVS